MIEFRDEITKNNSKKKIIYIGIIITLIVLIIGIVAIQMLKYEVEGEKKLPFELASMLIVSTADGIGQGNSENRWDLSILQNNDIYIEIKGNNEKNGSIKKIILENFTVSDGPEKGEPKIYHPVDDKDLIYLYKEENLVNDKIEYNLANENNVKKLEIARNGGIISFSSCSNNVGQYVSNDDMEVKYDGTLLAKIGATKEQIKYELSFDIIVEMESGKKYKANIILNLPLDNLIERGTVQEEFKDFSNVVFKRI